MKSLKSLLLVVAVALLSVFNLSAQQLELTSAVGSNMVLQQNSTVNIWGYAAPKSKVTVTCDWLKKSVTAKADADGVWVAPVAVPAASFDAHTITIKAGKQSKVLENILFGEVWLCAGQSNMEWPVRKTPDMQGELTGVNLFRESIFGFHL